MLFGFKNVDSHFVFCIFGLTIRVKHSFAKVKRRYVLEYGLNTEKRENNIIVSLTTFPQRINQVYITIEHLLTQTVKPDKLILWLAESQFPNKEDDLPESLLRLREFGLTIGWTEDTRSYKKLVPTLKDHKNDIIITYDDDIYYEKDSIEKLYKAYLEDKTCICTHRNSRVFFNNSGDLKFYKSRNLYFNNKMKKPSLFNTIIGCGGVLYPPNCLYKDIDNIELIRKTVPSQDDVYFWAMAVLNKTKIKVVDGFSSSLVTIEETQQYGLCKQNSASNTGLSGNQALNIMLKEFPEIIGILKEEGC